ncbi:MAG: branched-chain amino acid ABC transporter permease [Pseudomonadota bacterium]
MTMRKVLPFAALLAFGILAPMMFPAYTAQFSVLWVMVLLALTWDLQGGQMGYNSLGNIFFFGFGMYVSAVVQIGTVYDVGEYTAAFGGGITDFTPAQYYQGLVLGIIAAGILSAISAYILGWVLIGLRGPYFAIGTLGVAIAAGELFGAWDWVGAGSGISMPVFPSEDPTMTQFAFYVVNFVLAFILLMFLSWLYSTRFGLAINAIRDDEEKAEGMGLHTKTYKRICWAISAFFLGICGAIFGNMTGYIEPLEVAFQTINYGIFMVLMVLLGGKGTLWGPVIGAIVFHTIKEVTWTYLLGTQWVALGLLIVVIVVFFQQGILGWLMEKRPDWFGVRLDKKEAEA